MAVPQDFGLIEYGFFRLARGSGIDMAPCHIDHDGGHSHFMT